MVAINFYPLNEAYVRFEADAGIGRELKEKYSFFAPNYKWDKRYKLGYWNGKLSPINLKDKIIPKGLLKEIKKYLDEEDIAYIDHVGIPPTRKLTNEQVISFYEKIDGPFPPYKEQVDAFINCVTEARNIILAPTSLGKSYIIHGLNAYYKKQNLRTLIIIHRSNLVLQLKSNFEDEYNSREIYSTSTIYDDDNDTDVVITTWQSIKDYPKEWFNSFDVIIGDEVHRFKAKVIKDMLDKADAVGYRHGFTATLDNDSECDAMTLEGLFGKPIQIITLKEQIAKGISAKPNIYVVIIKYNNEIRKELRRQNEEEKKKGKSNEDFRVEAGFLEAMPERNQLIAKIALSLKGNTLVAFKNEEHGKSIFELIEGKTPFNTYFINGKVAKTKRFIIQKEIENLKNSITTISFGTGSEGINIPNLNNLIIGSQVKSMITVPQLIGRMIRKTEDKMTATVIDICDDLSHAGKDNIFLRHFKTRMKFYIKNNFNVKTKIITI